MLSPGTNEHERQRGIEVSNDINVSIEGEVVYQQDAVKKTSWEAKRSSI
jgi:hypothetical protein